jgi:hypothetical protein
MIVLVTVRVRVLVFVLRTVFVGMPVGVSVLVVVIVVVVLVIVGMFDAVGMAVGVRMLVFHVAPWGGGGGSRGFRARALAPRGDRLGFSFTSGRGNATLIRREVHRVA